MDFPTFLDRIDNRDNEAHNNLEKMFGAVEQRVFTYSRGGLGEGILTTKDQGLVAAHIIGLVILSVIALVAFIVLCAMRANLKNKVVMLISTPQYTSGLPQDFATQNKTQHFETICGICNTRLTDAELGETGPFRIPGDAAKVQAAFDLFESGNLEELERKLHEMRTDIGSENSFPVMSRDDVLCFIKKIYRESAGKDDMQEGAIPAFERIKQRVLNAPHNEMNEENLETCLKPALEDDAMRLQMEALRARVAATSAQTT